MTLATTTTNQAKIAKNTASSFGLPNYEMPKLDLPTREVPPAFRELADQGVAQVRDTYEKAKAATEKATNQLKEAYTAAAKGATDYNLKVIEIARANTNTAVDNAFELLGAKSLTEFVELSAKHARKQFEAMCAQTKELNEIAQTVTTEITVKDWRHGDSKVSTKVAQS
jgi:phasin